MGTWRFPLSSAGDPTDRQVPGERLHQGRDEGGDGGDGDDSPGDGAF